MIKIESDLETLLKKKIPNSLKHSHDAKSIEARLNKGGVHSYLKDFVYGSIDGTVTTFAVVSGVVGADLPSSTILILGMANLIADGFSMAAGNYLGTNTEVQEKKLIWEYEKQQVKANPKGEQTEVRQILINKGYEGELLEKNVEFYTSDEERWVELMVNEEYGIPSSFPSPIKAGAVTFIAFAAFGFIPLLTYVFGFPNPFFWSTVLTCISFLIIGSLKGTWTLETKRMSALKTLLLGATASALSYYVGYFIKALM